MLGGVQEVFGTGTVNAGVCSDSKQQWEQTLERHTAEERGGKRKDFLLTAEGEERAMLVMSWRAGWL